MTAKKPPVHLERHEVPMPPEVRKAFQIWLYQPRRNLAAIGEKMGVARSTILGYSKRYAWTKRAQAHDTMLDQTLLEMSAEATAAAREAQLKAIRKLVENLGLRMNRKGFVSRLRPEDVVRCLNLMVKLDRLTVGQSTENVQQSHEDALRELEGEE